MKFLRQQLDKVAHHFEPGGKFERLYPLYEAKDTFLFTPADVTTGKTHVRDAIDLKRVMITVVFALIPCLLFGIYNAGLQIAPSKNIASPGILEAFMIGLLPVMKIVMVSYIVGGICEVAFCIVRKHEINEGFLVTGLLFPLTLPVTIPLWAVAVGIAFGTIVGKEIFGGTGYNFLNPALTARAYVFFAHPKLISGDVWAPHVDGISGATPMAVGALAPAGGRETILQEFLEHGFTFSSMFWGAEMGSIGETALIPILIGAAILIVTGIGSWRIMLACVIGLFIGAQLMHLAPETSNSYLHLPFHYHLVMGGFLFGAVFMATDPVSAAATNTGKWIYGIMIGILTVIIRVANPAYAEGVMLSILFMNVMAPVIDHYVVEAHIRKRQAYLRSFNHAQ
jgi:Na+-transporting NADH:ubiquinone oxidoreductase subunit B